VQESDLVKVNFRISERQLEAIRELVEKGEFASISEFVREAIERMVSEYRRKLVV